MKTRLFGPAYRGWNTLLEMLIEKGAEVNVVSKAGVTPWLAASGYGDRLGGVLYNKAGADILAQTRRRSEARTVPARPRTSAGETERMHDECSERMRRCKACCTACAGFAARRCVLLASAIRPDRPRSAGARRRRLPQLPLRELVTTYCVTCHNERLKTGNLALDKADADQVFNSAETWEKVVVKLRSRSMPPAGIRRPDNATYDAVATWLETELDRAAAAH